MQFIETKIDGAYIIDPTKHEDDRGFFARRWCKDIFEKQGLSTDFVQANTGYSRRRGTLRGVHYQTAPHEEAKLVSCTRGSVYDVMVDLRDGSPSFGEWLGIELNDRDHRMVYVPAGCAHGYLTLEDDTELFYPVTAAYHPESEGGIRYDDPSFDIQWPIDIEVISDKDASWPYV